MHSYLCFMPHFYYGSGNIFIFVFCFVLWYKCYLFFDRDSLERPQCRQSYFYARVHLSSVMKIITLELQKRLEKMLAQRWVVCASLCFTGDVKEDFLCLQKKNALHNKVCFAGMWFFGGESLYEFEDGKKNVAPITKELEHV